MIHRLCSGLALTLLASEANAITITDSMLAQLEAQHQEEATAEDPDGPDVDIDINGDVDEADIETETERNGGTIDIDIDFDIDIVRPYVAPPVVEEEPEVVEEPAEAEPTTPVVTPIPAHFHAELSDATTLTDGTTWADLKVTAFSNGYKESTDYTELSSRDKALVDMLIDAQTTSGDNSAVLVGSGIVQIHYDAAIYPEEPAPACVPDHLIVILQYDSTVVDEKSLSEWVDQTTILSDTEAFKMTTDYTERPAFVRALLDAFIEEWPTKQAAIESGPGSVVQLEWTDGENESFGGYILDILIDTYTTVNCQRWRDLRAEAMGEGYIESAAFTDLSELDQTIVQELITKQGEQEFFDSDFPEAYSVSLVTT